MRTLAVLLSILFGCHAGLAAERNAQTVVITAKPRFEQRGQFVTLIISDTNHSFDIGWGMLPDIQVFPVSLDTNRVYTFTVDQKPVRRISVPQLHKVESGGQAIYNIEICEVHKAKMEHKEVMIVYGLIRQGIDEPSGDIERRVFPHRREASLGGCIIMPDSPKTERVYVCSDCKKAYESWTSEYKKPK